MTEPQSPKPSRNQDMAQRIRHKERRRLKAERTKGEIWFGFGKFGTVGFAVAVPLVVCIFIGVWLEDRWPMGFSWTLTMILVGLALGLANAWLWMHRERSHIVQCQEDDDDCQLR